VRCAPVGRSSGFRRELENVRIRCGHGIRLIFGLGRCLDSRGAGGDKAPLPSAVKASTCLMHDSHNARRR
jgi:hypothetical protein